MTLDGRSRGQLANLVNHEIGCQNLNSVCMYSDFFLTHHVKVLGITNSNNDNTRTMFMALTSWFRIIAQVHLVHAMNALTSLAV